MFYAEGFGDGGGKGWRAERVRAAEWQAETESEVVRDKRILSHTEVMGLTLLVKLRRFCAIHSSAMSSVVLAFCRENITKNILRNFIW